MKTKVISILIKGSFNINDVNAMVNEYFDFAINTYKGANPLKIANIISTLY